HPRHGDAPRDGTPRVRRPVIQAPQREVVKTSDRPLVVGSAGGTGSGKTTVAHHLSAAMPVGRCVTIEHDAYYRDQGHLPPEERATINYDHPAALESGLLAEHLRDRR